MTSEKDFFIFKNAEMIRLRKGISLAEVRKLLGTEYAVEACFDKTMKNGYMTFP